VDRGTAAGQRRIAELGRELRETRIDRGLSSREVARAIGCSHSEVLRAERALIRNISLLRLSQMAAVVGLDLSARLFPGGSHVRDKPQATLLERLHVRLHPELGWGTEVPFPIPGDQRAWDALIRGSDWRQGVEAETGPRDGQALARRLNLKLRDGAVDGVILLLPNVRRIRDFLAVAGPALRADFPLSGATILERLAAGQAPGGSGIVLL